MSRPPDRKIPQILFTQGTSEWITRVSNKHRQLSDLQLSSERNASLDRWCEIEFVYATLQLEGSDVSRKLVSSVVDSLTNDDSAVEIAALLDSYRSLTSLVKAKGKKSNLTLELLLKLHSVPEAGLRTQTLDQNRRIEADQLSNLLTNALSWYVADSFSELNPVEQSALVLLRLLDIHPFADQNEKTALLAASLFTLRSDLPPIIVKAELQPRYRNALAEASRMNTQPMVETIATAMENSLAEMFEIASKK